MAGLYIHVPYCHSKCAYCDFYSTARTVDPRYTATILDEYSRRRGELTEPVETVYFGGGTPSILPEDDLRLLLRRFARLNPTEFTVEVNPEDVSDRLCRLLADCGVNRVSMGIQSFDARELKTIGRRHSPDDALRALERLRSAGLENISGDLIFGLPGQTLQSWERSLGRLLGLGLPHFSAYLLSYEEGTRLFRWLEAGRVEEASEEFVTEMYRLLIGEARRGGYSHYEISNYSLPGREALHNTNYWRSRPYLGLGPGAHSFDGLVRRYNPSSLKEYLESGGRITLVDDEDETSRINDRIITALRTREGLDVATVPPSVLDAGRPWLAEGHMLLTDGRLSIAEPSLLISDRILTDLIII